jgi:hypothetical protein
MYISSNLTTSQIKILIYVLQLNGLNFMQINNWFQYFPRAQFHFIRSEDFFQNTETELIQIYNFLEISIKPANDLLPQNTNSYPLLS